MSEFLKCDAAGCDHRETVDAITPEMVGKACPVCGANLLTQSDWDYYSTVVRPGLDAMATLGLIKPAQADTPANLRMSVNYHDGEFKVRLPS